MDKSEGMGPVIRVDTLCKKCGTKTEHQIQGFYSCRVCNAWTDKVIKKRIRLFSTNVT